MRISKSNTETLKKLQKKLETYAYGISNKFNQNVLLNACKLHRNYHSKRMFHCIHILNFCVPYPWPLCRILFKDKETAFPDFFSKQNYYSTWSNRNRTPSLNNWKEWRKPNKKFHLHFHCPAAQFICSDFIKTLERKRKQRERKHCGKQIKTNIYLL